MKVRMILLRVFSGILAFVCVLCLALNGIGLKQMLDCKTYWEKQGADATENFDKLEDGISIADWIYAAINGDVQRQGLALLER